MGHIRERNLRDGSVRYQAEIRLKGHPTLTAVFDRKTDAKNWIQKVEADIRCGRQQLYPNAKRHTFKEAVDRYFKEQIVSVVKCTATVMMAPRRHAVGTFHHRPASASWHLPSPADDNFLAPPPSPACDTRLAPHITHRRQILGT